MSENKATLTTTEEIHARCLELGIEVGRKGDAKLLEAIEAAEAALANAAQVTETAPQGDATAEAMNLMAEAFAKAMSSAKPAAQPQVKKNAQSELGRAVTLALQGKKNLIAEYRNQEKVTVEIAPTYADYFGRKMYIELNGVEIWVPCDGRRYDIPNSFAMEVAARKRRVNDQMMRAGKMSDYQSNHEMKVGELDLISVAK